MTTTEEALPRVPDAAWLEARFGAGSLLQGRRRPGE